MVSHEHADFSPVESMDLAGGDLCLDFVNTASGRASGALEEKLRSYDDVVTWAERVGLLSEKRGRTLRNVAVRSPRDAQLVLDRARELREASYRLFVAAEPAGEDLELLGEEAGLAAAERQLISGPEGYRWGWPDSDRLEQVLWPVALSATDLLTSENRSLVKECAADNCSWLFLDMSRNHSRRWCDMKVCGNRAKARRFSARHRGE
jgi:predicted RNA-binding Zn ribbon-like protein